MRYGAAALIALLAVLWTAVVGAQPAPAVSGPDTARQLFDRGVAAIQERRFDEGLGDLQRSYALRPSASVSLQMGIALQELGRLVEARERFQDFLHLASPSLQTQYGSEVTERMADVGRRLSHVRVTTLEPETARLTVDGRVVSLDVSRDVAVDPGEHILAAESAGRARQWQRVHVLSGQRLDVQFTLRQVPGVGEVSHPFYTQWWFWTGVAVVAAAVTTTVVIVDSGPTAPPPTNTGVVYQLLSARVRVPLP